MGIRASFRHILAAAWGCTMGLAGGTLSAQPTGTLILTATEDVQFVASLNQQLIHSPAYGSLRVAALPGGSYRLHLSVFGPRGGDALSEEIAIKPGEALHFSVQLPRGKKPRLSWMDTYPEKSMPTDMPPIAHSCLARRMSNGMLYFAFPEDSLNADGMHEGIPGECSKPMHPALLNTTLAQMGEQDQEAERLATARAATEKTDCLSSEQTWLLMKALAQDSSRLQLAQLAWLQVSDPGLFRLVDAAFEQETYVAHLKEYQTVNPRYMKVPLEGFGYGEDMRRGKTYTDELDAAGHCLHPIDSAAFQAIKAELQVQNFESEKTQYLQTQAQVHCFTIAQLRQLLAQLRFERSRLETVRLIFPAIYDPENYAALLSDFRYESNRENLTRFMKANAQKPRR
ncbi:MAG: DUF4476 domain-containing protein [Bacteroidetes bacterium]|nr:DUF4476 domain-containing protein [Bacteroidota bacterium]